MSVICTPLFIRQLTTILRAKAYTDPQEAKRFKLYLETILINMPTKAQKYKPSIYFDDDHARDIEHQGYTIPFYYDEKRGDYLLLGIIDNKP